jgi:rhodanese-related sulfurtransferase
MSKRRKHHEVSADATGVKVPPPSEAILSSGGSRGINWSIVAVQLLAITALSCVLGFTFNAANPLGVQFQQPDAASAVVKSVATNAVFSIESGTAPIAATRTNPPAVSPSKPTNIVMATAPSAPAPKPTITSTPWSVPVAGITNPVMVAAPAPLLSPTNPAAIHWPEAKALVAAGTAVLVDVRHKAMFDAGHIPGATSLPEWSPPEEFKNFLAQQATNATVVVYCSSTSCSQSARVANRLVNEFRWPSVRYMTGGYAEYQQAELAKPAIAPPPVP